MNAKTSQNSVLKTWVEESTHNYKDGQYITKVFNCPGARYFTVEFDARCATERQYDYLEFTDSAGTRTKYDNQVDTELWPLRVDFQGSKLNFLFRSDQSNNDWGYKFVVCIQLYCAVPIVGHDHGVISRNALFVGNGQGCSQLFNRPSF